MIRSRAINAFGASLSGLVLVIVIVTKFTKGAYLVLIAMPILYADHAGDQPALHAGRPRSWPPTSAG